MANIQVFLRQQISILSFCHSVFCFSVPEAYIMQGRHTSGLFYSLGCIKNSKFLSLVRYSLYFYTHLTLCMLCTVLVLPCLFHFNQCCCGT